MELRQALGVCKAELLVPNDDIAFSLLNTLVGSLGDAPGDRQLAELVEKSLGPRRWFEARRSKSLTLEQAGTLGLRVPARRTISRMEEALEFGRDHGYPIVLKRDFGGGGTQVFIARSEEGVGAGYASVAAKVRKGWLSRGRGLARDWQRKLQGESLWEQQRHHSGIAVEQYVSGKPALCAYVAREGVLLASIAAFKERTFPDEKGPSAVVRPFVNAEVENTVKEMLRFWKVTGYGMFDFMVTPEGAAYLIESNPRLGAPFSWARNYGVDFAAAMRALIDGTDFSCPVVTEARAGTLALFPQDWYRDAQEFAEAADFRDVPWDDPDLLAAMARLHPAASARSGLVSG